MAMTTVMVPEGHTVQVHPPGMVHPNPGPGMIPDPAAAGALAAMNAAMPTQEQVTQKTQGTKEQPKRKKPEARPQENGGKNGKTPR